MYAICGCGSTLISGKRSVRVGGALTFRTHQMAKPGDAQLGEYKPLKYPDMFCAADLMLLNKCDLLPYLAFDADLAIVYTQRVNPTMQVIRISANSGEGMPAWLKKGRAHAQNYA